MLEQIAYICKFINTRELATLSWIGIGFVLCGFTRHMRGPLIHLISCFFVKRIQVTLLLMVLWIALEVILLHTRGLWKKELLFSTMAWSAGVGFISIVKSLDMKASLTIKELVARSVQWTILVEFVAGTYTFSFATELLVLPFLFLLSACSAYAAKESKHAQAKKLIDGLIGLAGLALFSYSGYIIHQKWNEFATFLSFLKLITPIMLLVGYLPFLIAVKKFSDYEQGKLRI